MSTELLVAFGTLFVLEVILGIDNIIFIAILSSKLPEAEQARARQLGIGLAVVSRILLLFAVGWVISLDENTLFTIFDKGITGRDLVLLVGGLFLIGKSTYEIHDKLEGEEHGHEVSGAVTTLSSVLIQVLILDVVFSLDSVITAIGITESMPVIVAAIIGAAVVMIFFAGMVSSFVERHPTMKMLALAFLILIGSLLVIEGWNHDAAEELHLKKLCVFRNGFCFCNRNFKHSFTSSF